MLVATHNTADTLLHVIHRFILRPCIFSITLGLSLYAHAEAIPLIQDYKITDTLTKSPQKEWTIIGYLAADNDLRDFAARNIKQMTQVGSNNHLNIAIQLNIRISGNQKITRRYLVEKDKILHMNADDPYSQQMDSGDPNTLISCCKWAIENYPARHYALVLWNHGTGIIDPVTGKIVRPADLFTYNPIIQKLELDRSVGFLDFIKGINDPTRGVCWDDTTGHYLTNQKLESALREICSTALRGKKFDLIIFDACLMSMLEIANIIKNYAHFMTGSQEVELGTGLDYGKVLEPFLFTVPDAKALGTHIVYMYEKTYGKITNDFTHTALQLDAITPLESNIHTIAQLLLQALHTQKNDSVKKAIRASRNKLVCTHFDEPSYIDLYHFYFNLRSNLKFFALANPQEEQELKNALANNLELGMQLIERAVIANVTGKNLSQARGISIYFPEHRIHSSYRKTNFANSNAWATFLTQYLLT
jgi:hypothetical protein